MNPPVKGLLEAAKRLQGKLKEYDAAAAIDVKEAESLICYLQEEIRGGALQIERSLYTFLLILRAGSDDHFPAPKPLHDFSRKLFGPPFPPPGEVFSGVEEDEDVWEALENLWCNFNEGDVCSRSSDLRWCMEMVRPRQAFTKAPPFLFESGDEDPLLPCGWGCRGRCMGPSPSSECSIISRGWWSRTRQENHEPEWRECKCRRVPWSPRSEVSQEVLLYPMELPEDPRPEKRPGSGNEACLNVFDLVDRLVYKENFLRLPLQNPGWHIRKAIEPKKKTRTINQAYGEVKMIHPDYRLLERPMLNPFRAKEARRLIQGLACSPFLRNLLLSSPPMSVLPLHYSLAAATEHARLWLLRSDLPVYLEHSTLTYASICTTDEPKDACEAFDKERFPSVLELRIRTRALHAFRKPRALNRRTGISVATVYLRESDVPEELLRSNENLWRGLLQLPIVEEEWSGSHHTTTERVCALASLVDFLEAEPREKKMWLLRHGKHKRSNMAEVLEDVRKALQGRETPREPSPPPVARRVSHQAHQAQGVQAFAPPPLLFCQIWAQNQTMAPPPPFVYQLLAPPPQHQVPFTPAAAGSGSHQLDPCTLITRPTPARRPSFTPV